VEKWGIETWLGIGAAGSAILGALWAGLRLLINGREDKSYEQGWQRVAALEEEVRLLRIALHKATQRGNDGWTISEVLSLALPLPLEDRIRVVRQVREMVERSLAIGGGK
jgi:hypothetical protein